MSLETGHMFDKNYVVSQICKQHPSEVATAALFPPKDFLDLMDILVEDFRKLMKENRGEWEGRFQRKACRYIGLQVLKSI